VFGPEQYHRLGDSALGYEAKAVLGSLARSHAATTNRRGIASNTPTSMLISEIGTEIYLGSCVPRLRPVSRLCNGSLSLSAGALE